MARSPRKRKQVTPPRLILDAGAVVAWSRGDARTRALLTRALELEVDIRIPVAVLAETLRGGPGDAPVHRVRNAVDVTATGEQVGWLAGALLGRTGGTKTVDSMVGAEAILAGAHVMTGDPEDLSRLLEKHPAVSVIAI